MSEDLMNQVREALSLVLDPHMGISIVEMGIVDGIEINEKNKTAKIVIKPTNPGCMSAANIAMQARQAAESVEGIDKAEIVVEGHMMADAISEMVNK
ncbi:metal-sulfur cluster assembly factor [Methanobacterium sp. CWC-01]|uniref:metal-sulfur cluster assembly factor n=1 Tax=Methanobacterium aridiramus TaxID=2584467 RepID=UPI0025790F45|nr:metal-sulfur cluster assembly factor [Methanobacterium sp. CWC-01]WJI08935.1 metal-sulfur cluster assembly factor [Methanobacterium sp. CWC-01]